MANKADALLEGIHRKINDAKAILPKIAIAQRRCNELKKSATAELTSIENLLAQTNDLCSIEENFKQLVRTIYDDSKPLDQQSHAKEFAEGLLPMVELATSHPVFRESAHLKNKRLIDVLLDIIGVPTSIA